MCPHRRHTPPLADFGRCPPVFSARRFQGPLNPHMTKCADISSHNFFSHPTMTGVPPQVIGNCQAPIGLPCRLYHGRCRLYLGSHWFFDEYMLARLKRQNCMSGVKFIRCRNNDAMKIGIGEHVIKISKDRLWRLCIMPFSKLCRPRRISAQDTPELCARGTRHGRRKPVIRYCSSSDKTDIKHHVNSPSLLVFDSLSSC